LNIFAEYRHSILPYIYILSLIAALPLRVLAIGLLEYINTFIQ